MFRTRWISNCALLVLGNLRTADPADPMGPAAGCGGVPTTGTYLFHPEVGKTLFTVVWHEPGFLFHCLDIRF